MAGVSQQAVDWREVGLFVLITFGLSWTVWVGSKPIFPQLAVRTFLAMFGPTFGVIAVTRMRHRPLRRKRRLTRQRLVANFYASILAILVIGVTMAIGFALSLWTGDIKLPGSSGQDLFEVLPIPVALFTYWITAFGEEYGWRGFLTPVLSPLGGARASILTAVIFAAWHAPAILLDGFNFPRHHILGMFDMLVFSLPFSVVQAWLRSATGSVAAPTAAHATVNSLTGILYATTARSTSIIAAPVGLLGTAPFALLAVVLLVSGRLWRRVDPVSDVAPGSEAAAQAVG
jgi:membrane protease YdiL (CAAX protease family)